MPNDNFVAIGETFGIELEFETLSANTSIPRGWNKTHDASVESDHKLLSIGIPVETIPEDLKKLINYSNIVVGTELVSRILTTEDDEFLEEIKSVINIATTCGEKDFSERCGIHYHFSLPSPNLVILKSLLRLGRHFEKLFFTIGGMGFTNRGELNDATYFRPITREGAFCIPYRNQYAQVFHLESLLKTKKRTEFWYLYGDCLNHLDRYNPIRYHWLNLYPLCPYGQYKGTVEFRVFNSSLNPMFIYATIMLCKKFLQLVLKSSFSTLKELEMLDEWSVYDPNITKNDLYRQLLRLHELTDFDEKTLKILMTILERSNIPRIQEGFVLTHLRNRLNPYWESDNYIPPLIRSEQIRRPNFVDIHVLRGE